MCNYLRMLEIVTIVNSHTYASYLTGNNVDLPAVMWACKLWFGNELTWSRSCQWFHTNTGIRWCIHQCHPLAGGVSAWQMFHIKGHVIHTLYIGLETVRENKYIIINIHATFWCNDPGAVNAQKRAKVVQPARIAVSEIMYFNISKTM